MVASTLNNLAVVYQSQGKSGEAVDLLQRALAIEENALGQSDLAVVMTSFVLALNYSDADNHQLALTFSRKSTAAVIAHALTNYSGSQRPDNAGSLIEQRANYFVLHAANLAAASRAGIYPALDMGHEAFEIA